MHNDEVQKIVDEFTVAEQMASPKVQLTGGVVVLAADQDNDGWRILMSIGVGHGSGAWKYSRCLASALSPVPKRTYSLDGLTEAQVRAVAKWWGIAEGGPARALGKAARRTCEAEGWAANDG